MLILPIKKHWFDLIASGEKKEEYRKLGPYWSTRFTPLFGADFRTPGTTKTVLLRNGYGKARPTLRCRCSLGIGEGRPEWGAVPGRIYYVLRIHEVRIE